MSEMSSDAKLEKAVGNPASSVQSTTPSKGKNDDNWATECPFCHSLAVAGGKLPYQCKCGQTSINQAGQVFGLVNGDAVYRENKPSAVVRTVAEFKDLEESGRVNLVE